jgi:hypothetical protein
MENVRLNNIDAAKYIGVAPQTLNRWRVEGFGPHFLKLGARVLYDQRDLDRWLDANRFRSTSEVMESWQSPSDPHKPVCVTRPQHAR